MGGGLLVGMVLSLFDIPIRHATIDDLVNRLRRVVVGGGEEKKMPEQEA